MVLMRTLKHYKIRSTLPPVNGSVQWSIDNQIAVINRKGVMIYELTGDPKSDSDKEFASTLTFISISKDVPRINSGYTDDTIFSSLPKASLYDLMLDRILTPRGFSGIEFNNYFVRLLWSPYPFDSARPYYDVINTVPLQCDTHNVYKTSMIKPKCLLAGLTSNFQLKIYEKKHRRQYIDNKEPVVEEILPKTSSKKTSKDTDDDPESTKYHDGWLPLLDLSKIYNDILYSEWMKDEQDAEFSFGTYKKRMYQLSIIDFSWIEPWDDHDEFENDESNIMTLHCNGDIIIWRITLGDVDDTPLACEISFKENLLGNPTVAIHKFFKIANNLGVLAVGFKNGSVSVFRVERRMSMMRSRRSESTNDGQTSLYWIGNVESLCDSDELQIEFLDFVSIIKAEDEEKSPCVGLLAFKHPCTIICFKLRILNDGIVCEETNCYQSPVGHIVDVAKYSFDTFLMNHENGKLCFVQMQRDGRANFLTDSDEFIITDGDEEGVSTEGNEPDKNDSQNPDCLWLHQGFALSPNKMLGCFSKGLSMKHDSIVIKEPSECTFVSLFQTKDAWPIVKELYKLHDYNLDKIHDVLQGLRHQLRISKDFDPDRYLDGKTMSEMSLAEVKLYLWTLKAMGLPKPWKFVKDDYIAKDEIAKMTLKIVKNIALAEEQVMEKHLTKVLTTHLKKKDQTSKDPLNMKSAFVIRQYLQSKPSPKISKTSAVQCQPSECPQCAQSISFLNNENYDPSTGTTLPGIPGYKWRGQTCLNQHTVPVCVLSLVPFDYPNRVCPFCGCAALMEPAFSQQPICPFCDEFMEFSPMILPEDVSEEFSDEDEQMST